MKLMTLTFLRISSLIEAEWSEMDSPEKRWKVSDSAQVSFYSPPGITRCRRCLPRDRIVANCERAEARTTSYVRGTMEGSVESLWPGEEVPNIRFLYLGT